MDKEQYKTTSFLANVSDAEIVSILNKCGYRIYYEIERETDGERKPIERIYNPKTKKVYLEISCKNVSIENLSNLLLPVSGFFDINTYNVSLIIVNDYIMTDLMQNCLQSIPKNQLQDTFAKYMYNKFGEQYRLRYNKYHSKRNKKIDEEKEKM